jgi:hypothetical protein
LIPAAGLTNTHYCNVCKQQSRGGEAGKKEFESHLEPELVSDNSAFDVLVDGRTRGRVDVLVIEQLCLKMASQM